MVLRGSPTKSSSTRSTATSIGPTWAPRVNSNRARANGAKAVRRNHFGLEF